jgi:hypothetical protein
MPIYDGLKIGLAGAALMLAMALPPFAVSAQEQTAAADASGDTSATSPAPLDEDELEVLVARIALYPDELIALISGAALYPLQIVEAARFLDQYEKDKSLKPKESWDGAVVSLLNYPEIIRMMSDDLEWTQSLGTALAYQQQDVLVAIQQLRDEAVAKGAIRSDDKVQVVEANDNVVIRPTNPGTIYVPQYEPEMFYEPDHAWEPIGYYPDAYPPYWYPDAPFFSGVVTGAVWGAVVDWDDWGVWGGHWQGGDIDIDCNNCFKNRDFNGKIDFSNVDWKNIDRDKISFDRKQFSNFDHNEFKARVKQNSDNSVRARARDIRKADARLPGKRSGAAGGTKDVRKSVQDGLKAHGATLPAGGGQRIDRQAVASHAGKKKPSVNRERPRQTTISRPAGKPKPAHRVDHRPKKHSGLGTPQRGKVQHLSSSRGHHSMGGGHRGGPRTVHRGGGGRRR